MDDTEPDVENVEIGDVEYGVTVLLSGAEGDEGGDDGAVSVGDADAKIK